MGLRLSLVARPTVLLWFYLTCGIEPYMVLFANNNNRDIGEPLFRIGLGRPSRRRCGYRVNHSAPTLVWSDDLSKARLCRILKRTSIAPSPPSLPTHFQPMLLSSMPISISCRQGLTSCLWLQVNWAKASLGPSPIFYTASHDPQGRSREVPIREKGSRSKFLS
jgi:hypothetical protein